MQFLTRSIVALAALSGSLAAPGLLGTLINGPLNIPASFQHIGKALEATPFQMTFHLQGANLAGLAALMETNAENLADPLTMEEVASYATPSAADLTAVQNYLTSNGFTTEQMTFSVFKDQITVPTTVGQAAKLFATSFDTYSFGGVQIPRAKSYTIPSAIANQVT